MKRQMVSVFLTSMLILACSGPSRLCEQHIGVGRIAVVTSPNGNQTTVSADRNGNIVTVCGSTVSTV